MAKTAVGAAPATWIEQQKAQAKKLGISIRELTEAQALQQIRDKATQVAADAEKTHQAAIDATQAKRVADQMRRRAEDALAEILAMNKAGNMAVTVAPAKPVPPAAPDKLLEAWYHQGWALIAAGQHPCKTGLLKEYSDLYLKILRDLSDVSTEGEKR